MPPHRDLMDLLTALEHSKAEYLVIGGWAVGVHAEPRYTKDLDLLIGLDQANLARVVEALREFGAPGSILSEAAALTETEFLFFGTPPMRVDLLRSVPGIDFDEAFARRAEVLWLEQRVYVISKNDLIASKRAAGRPRDLNDVAALLRSSP
jgi:hypothetical protein